MSETYPSPQGLLAGTRDGRKFTSSAEEPCALMVSAHNYGSSGLSSGPGWEHCTVFLGKTLICHSASLHSGVQMGNDEFNARVRGE